MNGRGGFGRRAALVGSALLGPILLAPGLLGGPAHAESGIDIDHVDVTQEQVSLLLAIDRLPTGQRPSSDALSVLVDHQEVPGTVQPVASGDLERTTVLALDASKSMGADGIRAAQAAARAFVAAAPPDVRIGLLTFSDQVNDVVAPTTQRSSLNKAIDTLRRRQGTRVYDALAAAIELTGDAGARSVVLLSDGQDQGGGRSLDDIDQLLADESVVVDVVALGQAARERRVLAGIATSTGGNVIRATEPEALRGLFARQARALSRQVVVQFTPPPGAAEEVAVDLALAVGGRIFEDSVLVVLPSRVLEASGVTVGVSAAWAGSRVLLLGGAGAVGLGLAVAVAMAMLSRPTGNGADRRLATYFGEVSADKTPESLRSSATAFAQSVVPSDIEVRLARQLGAAGVPLRPAEWVLLRAGLAVVPGLVGLVLGGPLMMVMLFAGGVLSPGLYVRIRKARRLSAFGAQLPETLTMVANSLSAGLSVVQALDTVIRDGQEPMSGELRRALLEQRLGVDIEDALEGVAERMGSTDFAWVVMAIRIQREVGGNLSEVLLTVSETLRERELLRRQVRTLSAEGRLSAWILGGLPIGMFCYLMLANRDFIRPLYTELLGGMLLGTAVLLLAVGSWFMSRLVKVEI